MNFEDRLSPLDVGKIDVDLPVKPSGTKQSTVEDIRTVGRRHDDNALVGLKAIHLDKDLVQGLFTLIMSATEPGPSLTADGVDLIDENNARLVAFCHIKQVTHTRSTDTDVHFHEIGTADREERDTRFPGNRLGKQRFTRSGRADQQDPLGDLGPEVGELLGTLQEVNHFLEFLFLLLRPGNIGKADLDIGRYPCLGLAEVHDLAASAAHRTKDQEESNDPDDKNGNVEDIPPSGARIRIFKRDLNAHIHPFLQSPALRQVTIQAGAHGRICIRIARDVRIPIQIISAHNDFIDLQIVRDGTRLPLPVCTGVFYQINKLIISTHFLCVDLRRYHEVGRNSENRNQHNDDNRFDCLTQISSPF